MENVSTGQPGVMDQSMIRVKYIHRIQTGLAEITKNRGLPAPFKPLEYGYNHKLVKGKFEKSLDQLDNDIDKWIAVPFVLLSMNR